jgi:hypothetical protein
MREAGDQRVNRILKLQRENDIITLLLEGKQEKEIAAYIVNKYRLRYSTVSRLISEGRAMIRERMNFEMNTLLSLHIARYERIYQGLYEMGAYGIAMGALKAKEKLMQFHREGFHMRVTNGEVSQLSIRHVANEYDYMKLEEGKRKRMEELIKKVREKKQKELKA